jgi:uncharacterized protein YjbI with pentapeptide repeats
LSEALAQSILSDPKYGGSWLTPSRAGLLALAQRGQHVWNAWRNATLPRNVPVDFSDEDFTSVAPRIDFRGFDLRGKVSFAGARFSSDTTFERSTWTHATFNGAQFGRGASFYSATFEDEATFDDALFQGVAIFDSATFAKRVSFVRCRFAGAFSCKGAKYRGEASFESAMVADKSSFASAHFVGRASFTNAQLGASTSFSKAHFQSDAEFIAAQLGDELQFSETSFDADVSFERATVGEACNFVQANIRGTMSLSGSSFGTRTSYERANFGTLELDGAKFGDRVSFAKAFIRVLGKTTDLVFGTEASFDDTTFKGPISFAATLFGKDASFAGATFSGLADFSRARFKGDVSFRSEGGVPFGDVRFEGTYFGGTARFSGRAFKGTTSFRPSSRDDIRLPTVFVEAPDFHNCQLHQDTDFRDAEFRGISDPASAHRYRTLKLAMSQHQAVREERNFFRLEMMAERAQEQRRAAKLLYTAYSLFSDYGLSAKRPLIALGVVTLASLPLYGLAAGLKPSATPDWHATIQLVEYAALNALPVPGIDKTLTSLWEDLSSSGPVRVGILMPLVQFVHRWTALLAFFFIGLALRNFFKLK